MGVWACGRTNVYIFQNVLDYVDNLKTLKLTIFEILIFKDKESPSSSVGMIGGVVVDLSREFMRPHNNLLRLRPNAQSPALHHLSENVGNPQCLVLL